MERSSKRTLALKVLGMLLLAAVLIVGFVFWTRYIKTVKAYHIDPLSEETLSLADVGHTDKLMIVAHPDDETIWGGGHLMEGGYLVVCVTNGKNKERTQEFIDAVSKSGNNSLILSYPDKVLGERDDWEAVYDRIYDDIIYIMGYKDWSMIVTHNPDGEYGHIHHKMTSEIVTKAYDKLEPEAKLYYFGDYYKAASLPEVSRTYQRGAAGIQG